MKHPDRIANYPGSLAELARQAGDLRYDALAAFLAELSKKLAEDGAKDGAQGRRKLAVSLQRASGLLADTAREVEVTWAICAPHMPKADKS